jgi:hypothetical protein
VQLQIESVTKSKSGKSFVVKAGGKQYLANLESGLSQGMTIEAETKDSDFNGTLLTWIEKWKPVTTAAIPSPQTGTNSGGSAPWWMPFVSNVTAHAIQAGIIQTPNQIEAWAIAARNAAHKLETDIPF